MSPLQGQTKLGLDFDYVKGERKLKCITKHDIPIDCGRRGGSGAAHILDIVNGG